MTYFGTNIKKIRQIKGLSQQAFAEMFDLNRGVISSYEEGRAEPKIENLLKIAQKLNLTTDELLSKPITINKITNFKEIEDLVTDVPNNSFQLQEITAANGLIAFDLQKIFANVDFVYTVDDVLANQSFYVKDDLLLLSNDVSDVAKDSSFLIFNNKTVEVSETIKEGAKIFRILGVIQFKQNLSLIASILSRLEKLEAKFK